MKSLIAVAVAVLACSAAHADDLTGRWGIGGFAGEASPIGSRWVQDTAGTGADFGGWIRHGISPDWGWGASYDNIHSRHGGVRTQPVMGSLYRQLDTNSAFNPNVHAGLGWTQVTGVETGRNSGAFGAKAGFGADYFLAKWLSLGAAADYNFAARRTALGHEVHAFTFGLNLGCWFGGGASGSVPAPAARVQAPAPAPTPAPAAAMAPTKDQPVTIKLLIEFDTNKAVVKSEYDVELKKVADFLTKYPETKAEIEGHTDNVGSQEYNKGLSQRRAEAVRAALVERFHADAARLTSQGFGEDRPVAPNATAAGRAQNRRVVAVFRS